MTRFHVFVDNNASPLLANTLGALLRKDGLRAAHIREIEGLGASATDEQWITWIHRQPGEWIAVSGDRRISRNPAERSALRSTRARVLFLSKGFLAHPVSPMRHSAVELAGDPTSDGTSDATGAPGTRPEHSPHASPSAAVKSEERGGSASPRPSVTLRRRP